jgi:hypothetical protein
MTNGDGSGIIISRMYRHGKLLKAPCDGCEAGGGAEEIRAVVESFRRADVSGGKADND